MARTWLQIRIELLGGAGQDCSPPPGRDLIVGPGHTFAALAEAIDSAFARWDRSHLHAFTLADGRTLGPLDEPGDELDWLDDAHHKVLKELTPGTSFEYVFDLGDHWRHRCDVSDAKVDPQSVYGAIPLAPIAVYGWGSIPDQYRRRRP